MTSAYIDSLIFNSIIKDSDTIFTTQLIDCVITDLILSIDFYIEQYNASF